MDPTAARAQDKDEPRLTYASARWHSVVWGPWPTLHPLAGGGGPWGELKGTARGEEAAREGQKGHKHGISS